MVWPVWRWRSASPSLSPGPRRADTHRGAVDTFDRTVRVGKERGRIWVEPIYCINIYNMSSLSRIPDSVRYRELVWYCSVHGACVWTEERPWSCLDSTKTHAQPHYVIYKQVHLYVLRRHTFKTGSKRPCFQFLLCFFYTHYTEFGRKTAQSFVIAVEAVWIVKSTTCHLKMYDVIGASNKALPWMYIAAAMPKKKKKRFSISF